MFGQGNTRAGSRICCLARNCRGKPLASWDEHRNEIADANGAAFVSLGELLAASDVVSLHVPLTQATRHLIGQKELGKMKGTAYLINTSRGAVVDEKELAKALKSKSIAGAALDVFEHEPKVEPSLLNAQNAVLTPHIASASHEARSAMAELAAKNIIAALENS